MIQLNALKNIIEVKKGEEKIGEFIKVHESSKFLTKTYPSYMPRCLAIYENDLGFYPMTSHCIDLV